MMIFPKPLFFLLSFFFSPFFVQSLDSALFKGTRALREALGGPVAILDHSQPHEDQQAQHLGIGSTLLVRLVDRDFWILMD